MPAYVKFGTDEFKNFAEFVRISINSLTLDDIAMFAKKSCKRCYGKGIEGKLHKAQTIRDDGYLLCSCSIRTIMSTLNKQWEERVKEVKGI